MLYLPKFTFDVCKVPFHPDVAEVEQGQGEFYQCTAHLDGGMAGFRIDTSGVSHTDGEVYIPHHFEKTTGGISEIFIGL